jgi:putative transposon-encoded protein
LHIICFDQKMTTAQLVLLLLAKNIKRICTSASVDDGSEYVGWKGHELRIYFSPKCDGTLVFI